VFEVVGVSLLEEAVLLQRPILRKDRPLEPQPDPRKVALDRLKRTREKTYGAERVTVVTTKEAVAAFGGHMPWFFVLDAKGHVVGHRSGACDPEDLTAVIREALHPPGR
jgi:hypothetical protein